MHEGINHLLLAGTPARLAVPHSRCNDVPADALVGAGYEILTRSAETGHVREYDRSPFVRTLSPARERGLSGAAPVLSGCDNGRNPEQLEDFPNVAIVERFGGPTLPPNLASTLSPIDSELDRIGRFQKWVTDVDST